MRDIWSFLLQTLTASGAAALLLVLKAMFRDKLTPRWQFGAWSVLAMVLVIPAGRGGRYALFNWPYYVERLRSTLTGEYGELAQVTAPIPLPALTQLRSWEDWLFAVYVLGVLFLLFRYIAGYFRLRRALRGSRPIRDERIQEIGVRYELLTCPAVEAEGLSTAFVCGVRRPVLVLPAGEATDEKVILHELLHLENKDVLWGMVICLFRCIHWCNPLLWYCANRAGNDLEAMCDQRVLERLEGEERRQYGYILLGMASEKYPRAPGTSSIANGGKNIRRRVEAIARFKKYPAGMGLVSVCILLVLAVPLAAGAQAETAWHGAVNIPAQMAYARTVPCTTFLGALDTYAKAVLNQRYDYRAMCAPMADQERLAEDWQRAADTHTWCWTWPGSESLDMKSTSDYQYYNLVKVSEGVYEGVLAVELSHPPGRPARAEDTDTWVALQTVRTEKEGERWVVLPLEEFRAVPTGSFPFEEERSFNSGLPFWTYQAQYGDFVLEVKRQTVYDGRGYSSIDAGPADPWPDRNFLDWDHLDEVTVRYTGDETGKGQYTSIGLTADPIWWEGDQPRLWEPRPQGSVKAASSSVMSDVRTLEGDWEETVLLFYNETTGGMDYQAPLVYGAGLWLNGQLAAELTLLPAEGGNCND